MLVCNVSLRPPRRAIAADIAETAAAVDTSTLGNIVFATLVDDPASVLDQVDAYLGEIMLEAASASDTVTAGSAYATAVDEAVTAADALDATSAVIVTYATLNGTAENVTVTGGGLIATHNSTSSFSGVRSTAAKSTGKYYFEATLGATHGSSDAIGIVQTTAAVYSVDGVVTYSPSGFAGRILSGGINSGKHLGSDWAAGNIICFAFDFVNRKAWMRKSTGDWNNEAIGITNPATNTGGVDIPSGSFEPYVEFGSSSTTGDQVTMNFGASAFTGAVPSGFTAGWST